MVLLRGQLNLFRDQLTRSTHLTQPSFGEGIARILDIGGTIQDYPKFEPQYPYLRSKISNIYYLSEDIDAQSLASDWDRVAGDLRKVTKRLINKHHLPLEKSQETLTK